MSAGTREAPMSAGERELPMTECLGTDPTRWSIGPYHHALPGPMRMELELDGELVLSASAETGFAHRGLEKAFELHSWMAGPAYADRLDPEAAVFGELALCLAVERIAGIRVPPRGTAIRMVLCELGRIAAHMGYVVRLARAAGSESLQHYVLRDRERLLDLFELLTGQRFSLNFLRYGGVQADVTEGFVERVQEACQTVRVRLREYHHLLAQNHAFFRRTRGVGVIRAEWVSRHGITGPNARSAGAGFDVRKEHPYLSYDQVDFEVPSGPADAGGAPGDTHARLSVRLREMAQSVEILRQVCDQVPAGPFLAEPVGKDFAVPAGEAYVRVESARGLLGCHVVAEGGTCPGRVQFRPASYGSLSVVPELVTGLRVADLPVVLASLDIGLAEADR
jgi:NADH-quinone oxidoreductase subunit D